MTIHNVITNKSQLPKTGSTMSLENYDDGYYQYGSPITPRFIDNGDNTITDRATNLMWIKQPELIIPDGLNANNLGVNRGNYAINTAYNAGDLVIDTAFPLGSGSVWICISPYTSSSQTSFYTERQNNPTKWSSSASVWASQSGGLLYPTQFDCDPSIAPTDATTFLHSLVKSGHSDWFMPNAFQLLSIVNLGAYPAIYTTFFPTLQQNNYYASTAYASGPGNGGWAVNFGEGAMNSFPLRFMSYNYILPCRLLT